MAFDLSAHMPRAAAQHVQPTQKVSDLSAHVDGGQGGSSGSNAASSPNERAVLHTSVAIILTALILLWAMGALAFRGARL